MLLNGRRECVRNVFVVFLLLVTPALMNDFSDLLLHIWPLLIAFLQTKKNGLLSSFLVRDQGMNFKPLWINILLLFIGLIKNMLRKIKIGGLIWLIHHDILIHFEKCET